MGQRFGRRVIARCVYRRRTRSERTRCEIKQANQHGAKMLLHVSDVYPSVSWIQRRRHRFFFKNILILLWELDTFTVFRFFPTSAFFFRCKDARESVAARLIRRSTTERDGISEASRSNSFTTTRVAAAKSPFVQALRIGSLCSAKISSRPPASSSMVARWTYTTLILEKRGFVGWNWRSTLLA